MITPPLQFSSTIEQHRGADSTKRRVAAGLQDTTRVLDRAKLDEVTRKDLLRVRDHWQTVRGYADGTINVRLQTFKAFWSWCLVEETVKHDPTKRFTLKRPEAVQDRK